MEDDDETAEAEAQRQADQEIEALAACLDQRDPSDPVNR